MKTIINCNPGGVRIYANGKRLSCVQSCHIEMNTVRQFTHATVVLATGERRGYVVEAFDGERLLLVPYMSIVEDLSEVDRKLELVRQEEQNAPS